MTYNELCKKYNIINKNGCRYYKLDLNTENFGAEFSTPVYFEYNGFTVTHRPWNKLIVEILKILDEINHKIEFELLSFTVPWSKQTVFSVSHKTNYTLFKKFPETGHMIYVNTNNTAIHSLWLCAVLIQFYGINPQLCTLIVKKGQDGEPKEVLDYIYNENKKEFHDFLIRRDKTEKSAEVISHSIDVLSRTILRDEHVGGHDLVDFFYVGGDKNLVISHVKDIGKAIWEHYSNKPDFHKAAVRYFGYYRDFINERSMIFKARGD